MKQFWGFLLVACCLLGLVGCGGGAAPTTEGTTAPPVWKLNGVELGNEKLLRTAMQDRLHIDFTGAQILCAE